MPNSTNIPNQSQSYQDNLYQDDFVNLSKTRGFKLASINIVSLVKYIDQIRYIMDKNIFDILAVNETRLDDSVTDNMIAVKGYSVVRNDRNRRGGGVCVYLRNSINFKLRTDLISQTLEAVCVEIRKPSSKPFAVIACYRPPNSKIGHSDELFFKNFENLVAALDMEDKEIIALGDFNCDTSSPKPVNHTKKLLSLIENYQFVQLIKEPTRITESTSTIIDLILTNREQKIVQRGVIQIGISDHNLIYTVRKITIQKSGAHKYCTSRSFKHFDLNMFLGDLKLTDWSSVNSSSDINIRWQIWKNMFLGIIDKHAPLKTKRVKSLKNPWITPSKYSIESKMMLL